MTPLERDQLTVAYRWLLSARETCARPGECAEGPECQGCEIDLENTCDKLEQAIDMLDNLLTP